MSTIAFSQGCLRCGRISKSCDFGFQRFFQVRKGGAIWLTRRSGSLTRSPRIQKEVQLPTKISLPGTHPPPQDENRAPEALQSLPSDIWLDGQVGDFLPTGAQLTLNQLTQPLLNVGSFGFPQYRTCIGRCLRTCVQRSGAEAIGRIPASFSLSTRRACVHSQIQA